MAAYFATKSMPYGSLEGGGNEFIALLFLMKQFSAVDNSRNYVACSLWATLWQTTKNMAKNNFPFDNRRRNRATQRSKIQFA